MIKRDIFKLIRQEIDRAPEKRRTAEMHLQMLKYSEIFSEMSGREFCEGVGLGASFATEFSKMKNIFERLQSAGLDASRI